MWLGDCEYIIYVIVKLNHKKQTLKADQDHLFYFTYCSLNITFSNL